jgi:hypothetical protein
MILRRVRGSVRFLSRGDFRSVIARNPGASAVSGWLRIRAPRHIAAQTPNAADFTTRAP